MSLSRREGAPKHLPESAFEEISAEPGYKVVQEELCDVINRVKNLISKEPPVAIKIVVDSFRTKKGVNNFMVELCSKIHDEQRVKEIERTILELEQRCRNYHNYRERRRRQKYKIFRNDWFENGTKEDSEYRPPSEEDQEGIIPFLEEVPTVTGPRLSITNLMYSGTDGLGEDDFVKLISNLTLLCKNDPQFRIQQPATDTGISGQLPKRPCPRPGQFGPGKDDGVAPSNQTKDNTIKDILANWRISSFDLAFLISIKLEHLRKSALLNIKYILRRICLVEA
jgi:hypothetical protein